MTERYNIDSDEEQDWKEVARARHDEEAEDFREMTKAEEDAIKKTERDSRKLIDEHRRVHGVKCKMAQVCVGDNGTIADPTKLVTCYTCGMRVLPVGHAKQCGKLVRGSSESPGQAKVLCKICGFRVKPEGHEARCREKYSSGNTEMLRRLAWIGEARHVIDVRSWLLAVGTDVGGLEVEAQKYLSREARAEYFRSYPGKVLPPAGNSDHSLAVAFGANYHGEFRAAYLAEKFPSGSEFQFPDYLLPFFHKGFPFGEWT